MNNNATSTSKPQTLAHLGEFGLIARIQERIKADPRVLIGIGDDCSVCTFPAGEVLLTTKDLLLEDIHFRRKWTDMYSLGWKSAAVNLSDIAAMGGSARYVHLGIGIPSDICVTDLEEFTHGFLTLCEQEGATLCGGDTCRSSQGLSISVTVQGSAVQEEVCTRSGAQPGDLIYVSGTLGDSALTLLQLMQGEDPADATALRHHRPEPRLKLGRALAQQHLVNAMIDISDGIFSDLGHILECSKVGAELDTRSIPLSEGAKTHLNLHPERLEQLVRGGEDYELLFTAPAQEQKRIDEVSIKLGLPLTPVGSILPAEEGFCYIDHSGTLQRTSVGGFNHFSS
ncbi:MAG: thiamine-phosphate kinase [Desulfuromonadaceae bacterium]